MLSRFIITAIVLVIAFTAMILMPLIKNPVWWIHDFPQDIQEEYFRTHERVPSAFFSKTVLLKKCFGLLIALAMLVALISWIGLTPFLRLSWSAMAFGSSWIWNDLLNFILQCWHRR